MTDTPTPSPDSGDTTQMDQLIPDAETADDEPTAGASDGAAQDKATQDKGDVVNTSYAQI